MAETNSRFGWMNLTANGNIQPSRVVVGVTGAGNAKLVVQASTTGTVPPLGVSRENTRFPPNDPADDGNIAIAGEPVPAFGPGDIGNVTAGAAITDARFPLSYDNQGRAITAGTGSGNVWCFGWPMNTTLAAGDKVEFVFVVPFIGPT